VETNVVVGVIMAMVYVAEKKYILMDVGRQPV